MRLARIVWTKTGKTKVRGIFIVTFLLLNAFGGAPLSWAETSEPAQIEASQALKNSPSVSAERPDVFSKEHLVRTLAALVAVCAVAFVLIGRFGKRLERLAFRGKKVKEGQGAILTQVESLPLMRGVSLAVVETSAHECLVLSVTAQGAVLVATLDQEGRVCTVAPREQELPVGERENVLRVLQKT